MASSTLTEDEYRKLVTKRKAEVLQVRTYVVTGLVNRDTTVLLRVRLG